MSVELDGISDGWEISAGFLDGGDCFEKTETTWEGRKIVIQSTRGREEEIFQEQQIALAVIQELIKEDGLVYPLCGHDVTHLLSFEELFFDMEGEIQFAPPWDIDPNKQFMLASANLQNQLIRCGFRKFWKKHKTAILITAGAIVVVAGGAIAIAMLWPAAGSTAAGVGGAIASGLINGDSSPDNTSPSSPNNPHSTSGDSPVNTPLPPPSLKEPPKSFYNNNKPNLPAPPPIDFHSLLPSSQQIGSSFPSPNQMGGIKPSFINVPSVDLSSISPPANPFLNAPSSSGTVKPFDPGRFSTFSQPKPNYFPPLPQLPGTPLSTQGGGTNFMPLNPITKYFPPLPKLPGEPEPLALPPLPKEPDSRICIKTGVAPEYDPTKDMRSSQYKPSRSERMPTLGAQSSNLFIMNINGINTSWSEALSHQNYLGSLVNNQAPIDFIYNRTHGAALDLLEVFAMNYSRISPNTEKLLLQGWQEFADKHKNNPNKKILQPCHSQGAIHVYNALASAPEELRDRIIVVAIAPGKVVPERLCYRSFNYASKRDIVPLGNPLFVSIVEALNSNVEGSDNWRMTMEDQAELILLDPAPGIDSGIDHDFQSPTFKPKLIEHLDDYIEHNGEYP